MIEKVVRDGKIYFNINDYEKLHELFGQLLRETQRIKSEGDFEAVQALVEGYGVKVDQEVHKNVLERNEQFTSAPYSGFVNPVIEPVMDDEGEITGFNIPTGIPMLYELDDNLKPLSRRYVGDEEAARRAVPQYRDPWKFPEQYV